MFQPGQYISSLTDLLRERFGERLLYVGLQGSYLRGEADENSDIDIMAVIQNITVADLSAYREAISKLEGCEKSCGFICGEAELKHWNPLEICHLLHATEDYYGTLAALVPNYTQNDVRNYVKLSLGNFLHEITHRFIHASKAENTAMLPISCKAVFFILQNLHFLESGQFIGTRSKLLEVLSGRHKQALQLSIALSKGAETDFDEAFSLLFSWCSETLAGL